VTIDALLTAQEERFARLDRLLPPAPSPEPGEAVNAALPDGTRVAAVVTHQRTEPGMPSWLWSAPGHSGSTRSSSNRPAAAICRT
jgi:hypothetical protein